VTEKSITTASLLELTHVTRYSMILVLWYIMKT